MRTSLIKTAAEPIASRRHCPAGALAGIAAAGLARGRARRRSAQARRALRADAAAEVVDKMLEMANGQKERRALRPRLRRRPHRRSPPPRSTARAASASTSTRSASTEAQANAQQAGVSDRVQFRWRPVQEPTSRRPPSSRSTCCRTSTAGCGRSCGGSSRSARASSRTTSTWARNGRRSAPRRSAASVHLWTIPPELKNRA